MPVISAAIREPDQRIPVTVEHRRQFAVEVQFGENGIWNGTACPMDLGPESGKNVQYPVPHTL